MLWGRFWVGQRHCCGKCSCVRPCRVLVLVLVLGLKLELTFPFAMQEGLCRYLSSQKARAVEDMAWQDSLASGCGPPQACLT